MFDKGEVYMKKAEAIYHDEKSQIGRDLYRKFLMKKSSFMKKFGFFIDSIQILKDLETEVLELLKKPISDSKSILSCKKELFKIYRD